jgi:hypothetical protein
MPLPLLDPTPTHLRGKGKLWRFVPASKPMAAAGAFGPTPTSTALYVPHYVMFPVSGCAGICVSCRPSRVSASHQAAHPTPQSYHPVEHGSGPRVLPDILCLRPLQLRVYAGLLQAHRLVHPEVCS